MQEKWISHKSMGPRTRKQTRVYKKGGRRKKSGMDAVKKESELFKESRKKKDMLMNMKTTNLKCSIIKNG
jgi:hypothetical protein